MFPLFQYQYLTEGADVARYSWSLGTWVNALGGDDNVWGSQYSDRIRGGEGNDFLFGANGADTLFGENGNDTLSGGAHNDVLDGGAGFDRLIGGQGADTLTGGTEQDAFVFASTNDSYTSTGSWDTITDFHAFEGDYLDMPLAGNASNYQQVFYSFFQTGDQVLGSLGWLNQNAQMGKDFLLVSNPYYDTSWLLADTDNNNFYDSMVQLNGVGNGYYEFGYNNII